MLVESSIGTMVDVDGVLKARRKLWVKDDNENRNVRLGDLDGD